MQLLSRLPTRKYFVSLFVIVSGLFLIFTAVIYSRHQDDMRFSEATTYNYEVMRELRTIMADVLNMETGVRGYLLTGRKEFLDPYKNSQKILNQHLNEIEDLTKNEPDRETANAERRGNIREYTGILKGQVEEKTTLGDLPFPQAELKLQKEKMDELRASFDAKVQERRDLLTLQFEGTKQQHRNFNIMLVISVVLSIGSMLIATLVIISLINRGHRVERARRDAEDRFLIVMNGLNDGLYDYDIKAGNLYFSPAYKKMLGYGNDEFSNTLESFQKSLHPDDKEAAWDVFNQYCEGKMPVYTNVFRMGHKDGHWIWVMSRGIGLKDESGKIYRLIGTHTDITEQKQREEVLEQLNKELETFTYITSHDLRSPLVNIKGFSKELEISTQKLSDIVVANKEKFSEKDIRQMDALFVNDIPESLRYIFTAVDRMDDLTRAVLDLSRSGKRELHFEAINTKVIMQRCVDTLNFEITEKGAEVVLGDLPEIVADAIALEQIFANILDNAVKYLDPSRPGKIEIAAQKTTSNFIFSVRDNGRGIDDADKPKVFQSFRRARNTSNVRGLGMGMAFVQTTVRRLGGSIWFESVPEQGTTFHIALPIQRLKGE